MQDLRARAKKIVQLGLAAYLVASVFYTTAYFLVSPLSALFSCVYGSGDHGFTRKLAQSHKASDPRMDLIAQTLDAKEYPASDSKNDFLESLLPIDDVLYLPNTGSTESMPTAIRESTLLSKAFSQSMHPTKIIPFFYQATGQIDQADVTITTLVTRNRFKVLKKLVERYQGACPVCLIPDMRLIAYQALSR